VRRAGDLPRRALDVSEGGKRSDVRRGYDSVTVPPARPDLPDPPDPPDSPDRPDPPDRPDRPDPPDLPDLVSRRHADRQRGRV